MFTASNFSLKTAGTLNDLVQDYLEKSEKLKPYYGFYPDREGFSKLLSTNPYPLFNRPQLSDILLEQHKLVANTSRKTTEHILKLREKNVFTITTGHQLCLFTGPLYFIYKIISAINLAEKLNTEFPSCYFVPVYWMASEDHDFKEINHLHLFGKKLVWQTEQTGAVGDFKTKELERFKNDLRDVLGTSENASYLVSLFEHAYLQHETLSEATRFLVNELFGDYGLVTLDGNDKKFKDQFVDHFKADIFGESHFKAVTESIDSLKSLGYEAQVKPRQINSFFLKTGFRGRFEGDGETYKVVGSDLSFTKPELERLIEEHSETISPNVVLRPLYQQCILPNVAYIGGPGELAYWLEFKKMFDSHTVQFPILIPRNFISIIEKPLKNKIRKLDFSEEDFFKSETELLKQMQIKSGAVFVVVEEKEKLSKIYQVLSEKIIDIDKTLVGSVNAELQKVLSGLENISGKANRAIKLQMDSEIGQIKNIKQKIFPEGIPQERYENFSAFYLRFGKEFLKTLKNKTDPFVIEQYLLIED